MPPLNPNPRRHLNTGEKPASKPQHKAPEPKQLPSPEPSPKPASEPNEARRKAPDDKPKPDQRIMVGTKLEPAEVAKLDRLARKIGGLVKATRSATLRWLVQTADE